MSALDYNDPDDNESVLSLFLRMYNIADLMKFGSNLAMNSKNVVPSAEKPPQESTQDAVKSAP